MNMRVLFGWILIMGLAYSSALAEKKETNVPEIPPTRAQMKTLPNGLTIIVEEDRSAPVASVQAWCATGSIHEGARLGAGLSHILEHMLFKGTEKRKAGDIAKQVQEQGGYINAYTSFDRTVYWIDIPSTGVAEAISILTDAMMHSTLPEEEYGKEQEVIRREFAMGFDNPDRMSFQLMFRTVFQESPYRHPVIGYLDVYNALTRQDVMDYYKARYVPNNLTFVIVGDVDAKKIFAQIEKEMGDFPRKALEPVYIPSEPAQLGKREVHEEFPSELTRLSLAWRIPGLSHPDVPALSALASILGDGRSSILYRKLREEKGLVHSIHSGTFTPDQAGIFAVLSVTDPDKRNATQVEILETIKKIKKEGVTKEELDKVKRGLVASQLTEWSTMRGKASDLGSNWLLAHNPDFSRDYLRMVEALTPEDIQRVANQYLREDGLSITSLNPPAEKNTSSDQNAQVSDQETAVQKFVLSNGLRVLVHQDKRLPLVSMVAAFRGGLLAETAENNGITKLLSQSILKGTTTRSAEKIAQEIEDVGGSLSSASGNNSFSVSIDVMQPDLNLGLQLLADILLHPTFPENEVAREKEVQLAGIKSEQDQITTVGRNLLREKLFGSHPYALRAMGTPESVVHLTSEDLRKFYETLTVGHNGVLAVFGDVDPEQVRDLCEKYFGKLPAGKLALENPPVAEPLEKSVSTEKLLDKQQAVVMVGYPGISVTDPDGAALELIESASSDLGSRFFNRIREKNALAYFVGASSFSGLAPGLFVFYLGTDPAKAGKATTELQDEIQNLAQHGLTEEELARAKKKVLGQDAIQRQGNGAFATRSALDELVGLGFDHYKKREAEIQAVTLEDTRRVAQRILKQPGSVLAIVKPPLLEQTSSQTKNP